MVDWVGAERIGFAMGRRAESSSRRWIPLPGATTRVATAVLVVVVVVLEPFRVAAQARPQFVVPPTRAVAPVAQATEAASDWLVHFDLGGIGRFPTAALAQLEAVLAGLGLAARARALPLPDAVRLTLSDARTQSELRAALSRYAPVLRLEPNRRWRPARTPNDPRYPKQWGLANSGQRLLTAQDMAADGYSAACDSAPDDGFDVCDRDPGTPGVDIGAETAWERRTDASEVLVAIVDSGLDIHHPDLAPQVWRNEQETINGIDDDGNGFVDDVDGWDACDDDGSPDDLIGHGTQAAGIVAAAGDDGFGISGVAWSAQLVGIKFIGPEPVPAGNDCNLTSAALDALEFARVVGADVVNMSWGGPDDDPFLRQKLEELAAAGIVLVAATGNDAADLDISPFYPASYEIPGLISVAAHTNDGRVSSFSNTGGATDLAAPGMSVQTDEQAYEDAWEFRNFDGYSGPAKVLGSGQILGTNFRVVEADATWGIASLSNGSIAVIGDFEAAELGDAHGANLDQTLEGDPFDAATWGRALLRFGVVHDLGEGAELRLQYSTNGGASWQTVPGASFTGYGANLLTINFANILDALPSDLRVRFHLQTDAAHRDDDSVDTLDGGVYLYDVGWLRTGDETFNYGIAGERVFAFVQGTSFAAPFVAGAAALLKAEYPQLSPLAVVQQLIVSAATLNDVAPGIPFARRLEISTLFDLEPTLVWRGGTDFRNDGVDPDTVSVGEPVTLAVGLFDPEGQIGAATAGAWITAPGGTARYVALAADAEGWSGTTTFAVGGEHRYRFVVTGPSGELGGEPSQAQTIIVAGESFPSDDTPDGNGSSASGGGGGGCSVSAGSRSNGASGGEAVLVLLSLVFGRSRRMRRVTT